MIINPFSFGGGGGGASLYDEIIARSPALYWRHAEAAGTTMEEEGGNDGIYTASGMPNKTAIYPGGPTCIQTGSGLGIGRYSGTVPALNSLSVFGVVNFVAVSGTQGIISNDDNTNRHWQFRGNGTNLDFVKINIGGGSVVTVTATGVLVAAQAQTLGATVDSAGVIKLYVNGANVQTSSATGAFNYGGSGQIEIGGATGGGGITTNGYFSESAIFNTELSAADFAAFHAASGL